MKKTIIFLLYASISALITISIISCDFISSGDKIYTDTNVVIADHNAVQEFESIPDYWLNEAKKLAIHFGHTSHGSQIISGLYYLETYVDPVKYSVVVGPRNSERIPDLPSEENPPVLRIWEEGLWPDTADGHLGYWLGEDAIEGTVDVLDTGLFVVSGWSWCGQVALND